MKNGWQKPIGYTVGGFTIGHLATMARSKAIGTIVDLGGRDGRLTVTLEFNEPQPVDAPEGATSRRFELDSRNVTSTWIPPAPNLGEGHGQLAMTDETWDIKTHADGSITEASNGVILVPAEAQQLREAKALPQTSLSIEVNKFDDWGQVVGTKTVEMTRDQIADVVGHAAQLIAVHRASRRSSGDMEGIIAELDEAMNATDVMEDIGAHAEQKPKKSRSGPSMM